MKSNSQRPPKYDGHASNNKQHQSKTSQQHRPSHFKPSGGQHSQQGSYQGHRNGQYNNSYGNKGGQSHNQQEQPKKEPKVEAPKVVHEQYSPEQLTIFHQNMEKMNDQIETLRYRVPFGTTEQFPLYTPFINAVENLGGITRTQLYQLHRYTQCVLATQRHKFELDKINDGWYDAKNLPPIPDFFPYLNVTSLREPHLIFNQHIADSLSIIPIIDQLISTLPERKNYKIIDVGSGGGVPALILAILRPDWKITAADTVVKKCVFLRHTADLLGLLNFTVIAGGVQHYTLANTLAQPIPHLPQYNNYHAQKSFEETKSMLDAYDICVARGVTQMPQLLGLCLPLVRRGGYFLAMKSLLATAEQIQINVQPGTTSTDSSSSTTRAVLFKTEQQKYTAQLASFNTLLKQIIAMPWSPKPQETNVYEELSLEIRQALPMLPIYGVNAAPQYVHTDRFFEPISKDTKSKESNNNNNNNTNGLIDSPSDNEDEITSAHRKLTKHLSKLTERQHQLITPGEQAKISDVSKYCCIMRKSEPTDPTRVFRHRQEVLSTDFKQLQQAKTTGDVDAAVTGQDGIVGVQKYQKVNNAKNDKAVTAAAAVVDKNNKTETSVQEQENSDDVTALPIPQINVSLSKDQRAQLTGQSVFTSLAAAEEKDAVPVQKKRLLPKSITKLSPDEQLNAAEKLMNDAKARGENVDDYIALCEHLQNEIIYRFKKQQHQQQPKSQYIPEQTSKKSAPKIEGTVIRVDLRKGEGVVVPDSEKPRQKIGQSVAQFEQQSTTTPQVETKKSKKDKQSTTSEIVAPIASDKTQTTEQSDKPQQNDSTSSNTQSATPKASRKRKKRQTDAPVAVTADSNELPPAAVPEPTPEPATTVVTAPRKRSKKSTPSPTDASQLVQLESPSEPTKAVTASTAPTDSTADNSSQSPARSRRRRNKAPTA